MKTKRFLNILCLFFVLLFSAACSTPKQMTYLLDMKYNNPTLAGKAPELHIQSGDVLSIRVSTENMQLAAPFNLAANGTDANNQSASLFVVDSDGYITFPVLGALYVEGETIKEIQNTIAQQIVDKGYIREPVVNVSLQNFSVTVVGSAGNTVIPVQGPSINILQAIARSGKTDSHTNIKDVMVIRTEDGVRTAYHVNLQKKNLFDSPVFFLQQNDIVYIKPRGASLSSEGQTVMTFVSAGLTLGSIITNFLLWSRR